MSGSTTSTLLRLALGAALAAACAPEAATPGAVSAAPTPSDSTRVDSAAGEAVGTPTAAAPAAVAPEAAPMVADSAAPGDTSRKVTAQLLGGRKKTDMSSLIAAIRQGEKKLASWPKGPAAAPGALLPDKRIVAYYGNPHSKKMGVIGEYPEQQMLGMLDKTVASWKAADPATPVVPAIHLVTVVAQGDPGADKKWRRRETPQMIEKTYGWAQSRKGVLFLDIQASHSTLREELPLLLKYLERPDVHLGVDPEFYMHHDKEGVRPSAKIGQMKASDINYVIQTLDRLVTEKGIPPKVLVVHRFTRLMVPDAQQIRPTKNVQVVMHMDGWGPPWLKFDSYHHYIVNEPVQYTGFKLFYHNDTKKGDALLTPKELMQLKPALSYIQYQ
ncbi:hypothetical protein [Roseisolibacter sp. H3M3-2]|uniref:hypothetical protein n=1 Tax=Roseisolibacter sp. H3M3-2 TaxID=3031323 RepID=UPI0023DC51CA|nr:hypothetical protein [Roseisolibacter sp. H3M3-2]MDF1505467.1 hypothetical protein [Roseisolibacter sp. H3M3-2]